jgi:hypothetical protein
VKKLFLPTQRCHCEIGQRRQTADVSDNGVPAEPRLASINRQQLVLRSIDVERLVDEDHGARLIWELIGRLELGLYHAQIEAVEGRADGSTRTRSC